MAAGEHSEVGIRDFDDKIDGHNEEMRKLVYKNCRCNLPVVEVKPSLLQGQAYEAVCRIVRHKPEHIADSDKPTKVVWSAGPKFRVKEVYREDDEDFEVSFHYWGAMLIQAEIHFSDGEVATECVYAHIPETRLVKTEQGRQSRFALR